MIVQSKQERGDEVEGDGIFVRDCTQVQGPTSLEHGSLQLTWPADWVIPTRLLSFTSAVLRLL